jgi:hypothetical protein
MFFGEIVDAAAKDVVLCHDFDDIEAIMMPLHAVDRRAAFQKRFRDRLVRHSV